MTKINSLANGYGVIVQLQKESSKYLICLFTNEFLSIH